MSKSIMLIGFMGTGKDTVGRDLARRTGMGFISIDRYIELSQDKTIADIFRHHGEKKFRDMEHSALLTILALPHTVIATGGGIVARPENRMLIQENGMVVHLTACLEVIQKRLKECTTRPLALEPDQIARLYRDREGMYDIADITVATDQRTPDEIVENILGNLAIEPLGHSIEQTEMTVETQSASYKVLCGSGLFSDQTIFQAVAADSCRVCIVTNPLVGALYLDPLQQILQHVTRAIDHVIVPDGEQFKTMTSAFMIYDHLMKQRFSRSDLLVGLGGGVISDLTGFVAGTFKRGMRCVFIPTTLLGQVDAAIGGKNGINHDQGKNMIGMFYQPEKVISDVRVLQTLSEQEFQNGMAEVIKYGITHDQGLFAMLEQKQDTINVREQTIMAEIVKHCVKIKSAIIARDERETLDIRHQLNFGHTIGHAIETLTQYQHVAHGQAVTMGMVAEARAAVEHGYLDVQELDRIVNLIADYGLPTTMPHDLDMNSVRTLLSLDKKARGDAIKMPILQSIGNVTVKEVPCATFL